MRVPALSFVVVIAVIAIVVACSACGARTTPEGTGQAASPRSAADASAPAATTAGGGGGKDAGDERAFAGSTAEATSLISSAVDKKQAEINTCVREFRVRKNIARDRVAVSFGIDQEGKLLGVTSKGRKEDAEFRACVQEALKGATFPRSHAGVITVTKTYEELIQ